MKYCPTCETRYDEEVLRFCMKDGTPLLDEAEPNFVQMPSEDLEVPDVEEDDPSEVTIIRRNIPTPPVEQPPSPAPRDDEDYSDVRPNSGGQRIVVPMFEEQQRERARVAAQYQAQQPSRGANTILVVLLTIFGTIIVVGIGGALLYFLVVDRSGNTNANANANLNANQNVNANVSNGLFDFNTNSNNGNGNANANVNVNANTRTPTPTPTATPRPSETPSPTPDDDDPDATPTPVRTPIPTPTPIIIRPGATPTPPRTPAPTPRTIMTPSNRP